MKILVLEGDIYNSITGFRKNLVSELRKEHEVFIAGSVAYEWQEIEVLENDKHIIVLGQLQNTPANYIYYFLRLLLLIYKVKPDFCISFNLRPNLFLGMVSLIAKVKGIATITGTSFMFENESFALKSFRSIYRFFLFRFDAVFIQNQSDFDQFLSHSFRFKNHKVIPGSGVDIERFCPSIHKFSDRGSAKFIFIARLLKDKGFYEFVGAAEKIKKDTPNAQFFVLGSYYNGGNKSIEIDKHTINELHKNGIITYLGTTKNVIPFIEDMDCVVLPSYREGISNTLMEGASLAKPLITTDVPGCRELVDHTKNGYLCKVKSVDDLEEKMRMFIELPIEARKEMGRLGRDKMIASFNRQGVILEYTDFIKTFKK